MQSSAARRACATPLPSWVLDCASLRDVHRQRRDPPRLVAERAELRLEGDFRQPFGARGKRRLAVLLPEERRVGEPWPHDTLVAFDDLRGIAALDVGYGDEVG